MSEIIIEKLHEQRDFYLNTLKQLEFQLVMDPSENELKEIEKLQTTTVDQLKKVEQEIAFLTSKKHHNLQ
ncbi:hypothetical protein AAA799B03_00362 [Marine Group I thaumarchaeote SCGC AAA799-B03]|uniref:Uncharacterized protein n=3 Tax=Marine Group I TaxID=905826 RepID=A0A087S8H0_9ARCH|nr:hypothetical protein AAA799N04_00384 [Marine Group I thaumarchaeote SCGC AAA799-N04]KFM18050.1 hypothetical protein SCCGRSA3_01404 [Marine Group I thaumarchaeote SCGC RSA3]KFM22024.1 hypothetical protein AAA799B03_00362 [Marine Group I thaumarchaeote SCGC AAA799-B03]